jgi:iron complex outermembrane receptor protein
MTLLRRRVRPCRLAVAWLWVVLATAWAAGADPPKARFHLPEGDAAVTLRQFSQQTRTPIVYPVDAVRGVKTNPVQGEFTARAALDRLVAGTALFVSQDAATGALAVGRVARPDTTVTHAADAPVPSPENLPPSPAMTPPRSSFLSRMAAALGLALASPAVASTGLIEGRVLNADSGGYLENARVSVAGTAFETLTDSSGRYQLAGLPAGTAQVQVSFTGLAPMRASVEVRAGTAVQRDFEFRGSVVKLSEFVVGASREMDGAAIAINEQRFAPNVTKVVASGEFGISADGSVGEFIKYLPGVSIDYVGGTANTLSLDGVPSNNVPVTVGGFDLASTASASTARSAELLQISIQNIARLELIQSPTPESPGSALAGSVNLVPQSAFERSRPVHTASAYLMMRDNHRALGRTAGPLREGSRKIQPGFDFSSIVPVNRSLGFTVSGSYSRQFIPQDTVQTTWRGASAATNGTTFPATTPDRPYLSAFLLLDQIKFNDRKSFGATVDYRVANRSTLSFSYQFGQFASEFVGNTLTYTMNAVAAGGFGPGFSRGTPGTGEITNANSARWRSGDLHMPSLVFRHDGPLWRLEAGAGYSHSTNVLRDTSRGYFGSMTARRTGVTLAFEDIFYLRPGLIRVTEGATAAAVNPADLGSYALTAAGSPNPRDSVDAKRTAYANARRVLRVGEVPVTLKGGLDVRQVQRDMRGTNAALSFVGADGRASTTPTAAGSDDRASFLVDRDLSLRGAPFGFGQIQWMSPQAAWEYFRANPNHFTANPNTDYRNAVSLSKRAQETISSAYLRGDVALLGRRLKLTGGVRAEQANVKAEGPLSDPTRNVQRDASGRVIDGNPAQAGVQPVPIVPAANALGVSQLTFLDRGARAEKEYLRLFPSLNASYELRENLVARAAYYTSVGRPDYNQYAGGLTLPDTEAGSSPGNRITVNNVAIKAWQARTVKVRLEHYFEKVGQFAVGAFRRDFENFFGATVFRPTPEFLDLYDLDPSVYGNYDVATQYNLPNTVRMSGLEADYKQALTFLPHWARGVQVFANFTALRTTGDVNANFSGYVPRTYNWGVSLNREAFRLRAGWNYQGRRRLAPVTGVGIEPGTFNWRSKRLNLDVQGEYYFTRRVAGFFNLRNIGAAVEDFEIAGPGTPPHAQFRRREDYGASWTFGVKGTF